MECIYTVDGQFAKEKKMYKCCILCISMDSIRFYLYIYIRGFVTKQIYREPAPKEKAKGNSGKEKLPGR